MDNYENAQICTDEDIFTENIDPIISNVVETICGNDLIPKGTGTVS